MSAYLKVWYAANRDEKLAKDRAYHAAHRDQALATMRRYREDHVEEKAVADHRYYQSHRDEIAAYYQTWRDEHAEEKRLYDHEYHKAHPEESRAYNRNRRARERAAPGSHSAADIVAQRERQRGRCFYCGTRLNGDQHVDHVTPLVLGGSNGPENLVVTCPRCNLSKGPKHPADFHGVML